MDISLWRYVGGTAQNVPHYYWLWDNTLGKFVANEELEWISDYSYLEIDTENNRLISSWREGAWARGIDYFEYRDGQLEWIKRAEIFYQLGPEDDDRLTLVVISELIDGELTVVREYYWEINEALPE
jgi:hypothetical protein